jgi:hypothetical protein
MADPAAGRLFKFLAGGGDGRFSGARWPAPGEWLGSDGALEPCATGIHLCRTSDLPYWLDDELWEAEADGERVEGFECVVVERARLRSRVEAWPLPLAGRLAADCLGAVRRLVERELELAGDADGAELRAAGGDVEAAGLARALAGRDRPARPATAARLLALLADAGDYARSADEAGEVAVARSVAFIAAYAADRATPEPGTRLTPGETPFALERRRQADVLAAALG